MHHLIQVPSNDFNLYSFHVENESFLLSVQKIYDLYNTVQQINLSQLCFHETTLIKGLEHI